MHPTPPIAEVRARRFQPEDFHALYTLDAQCFAPPFRFSRGFLRRVVSAPEAVVWVALQADQTGTERPVGFCAVAPEPYHSETVGYVATLDVHPDRQRQGIGRMLLERCENTLRDGGIRTMLLHVWTENAAAMALYEATGYEQVERTPGFYQRRFDAWLYRKPLQ